MKFAHIADAHVGAWRDPALREINQEYFSTCIDNIISENVDCVLIAGDLFNTAVPSIDALKLVTQKLKQLSEKNISVYGIAGSHDYSASGKSMLEVLEKAGLFASVIKGEIIEGRLQLQPVKGPHGVSFSGLAGRRGTLEKEDYKNTDYSKIETQEQLIFLFHTTINEYSPKKEMKGISVNLLPKNAIYYAGGHIHYHFDTKTLTSTLAYPGPICPNNFAEWEDLKGGSYIIGNVEHDNISISRKFITTYPVINISYDVTEKIAVQIQDELIEQLSDKKDAIILLRLTGTKESSLSDINFATIEKKAKETGAKCVLRNSSGIAKKEQEIECKQITDINKVELEKIAESIENSKLQDTQLGRVEREKEEQFISSLMTNLSKEKKEGETATDYDERVKSDIAKMITHEL